MKNETVMGTSTMLIPSQPLSGGFFEEVASSCEVYRLERFRAKLEPTVSWSILSGKPGAAETAHTRTLG